MSKNLDVVLYGATGFTGQQCAHYFAEHVGHALKWALAGRNKSKLEKLRSELGADFANLPLIIADSGHPESIEDMAAQTRVLLTTAGPYAKYGEPVVKACVQHQTHYVDITGETPFVKGLIDHYHAEALDKGIKIVPFCGFDSVPSDLGVWFLNHEARKRLGESLAWAKGYFSAMGGFNGGTLDSVMNLIESGNMKMLGNPDLLTPDGAPKNGSKDQQMAQLDPHFKVWTAPFFMAPVNTRVVRRSAGLFALAEHPEAYASDFRYEECMYFNELLPAKSLAVSGTLTAMGILGQFPAVARLAKHIVPKPGTGPSEQTMAKGFFKCWLMGKTPSGKTIKGYVFDKGDPGNEVTVKILCESARCLAEDGDKLPKEFSGGILTPATAFGEILWKRLENQYMVFDIRG